MTSTTSNVSDPEVTHGYPTHVITLSDLNSGTTYDYSVIAINTTNMVQVGEPLCGSFTTRRISSENNDGM